MNTMNDYYLPLIVSLTAPDIRHHYDVNSILPAHELVIRPLLNSSNEAFVYGLKKGSVLYQNNEDILLKDRGKFKFDTRKECISGHELLWNITMWERGSIVLIIDANKMDFKEVFKECYGPGLSATPNSGNSLSATKKCKEEAAKGNIGICFPASNGIEWIQIYAKPDLTERLLEEAFAYCKKKDYE